VSEWSGGAQGVAADFGLLGCTRNWAEREEEKVKEKGLTIFEKASTY
jgi:hypothetical protein